MKPTLHLAIERADPVIGWGVCYTELGKRFAQKTQLIDLNDKSERFRSESHPGTSFCSIANNYTFERAFPGKFDRMFAYCFFEEQLNVESLFRTEDYEVVFAGSSWCVDRLKDAGVTHADTLIQGVDTEFFHPGGYKRKEDGKFRIFSGGKFEYRKGQDVVTKAFQVLQHKYKDLELECCWWNSWPFSYHTMALSTITDYPVLPDEVPWLDRMSWYFAWNRIYPNRVNIHGPMSRGTVRQVMLDTDIGVFPNRCEGGTNLVLMEYMALGKPVVATYTSGHKDIITEENSIPLCVSKDVHLVREDRLIAEWIDPNLDEVIASIEYAYEHRDELDAIGACAARDIRRNYTWDKASDKALKVMFG